MQARVAALARAGFLDRAVEVFSLLRGEFDQIATFGVAGSLGDELMDALGDLRAHLVIRHAMAPLRREGHSLPGILGRALLEDIKIGLAFELGVGNGGLSLSWLGGLLWGGRGGFELS